ncbi:Abhydrolase_3 domain-containing protein, partial [Cephalotus follicularis]
LVLERKLVDEVSGWLRVYDDGSVDRTWLGPSEFKFLTDPVPPHEDFIEGVATRDVTIDTNLGLRVRIYMPDHSLDDQCKLPTLLHFHGGGFCISQADWYMYYQMYTKIARSAQAIVISVYLRLAPENPLPAACDDGFLALLWLRSLAKGELHEPWLNDFADFNRVFLIGDSAGANLVHEVSSRAGQVDLSPVRLAGGIPVHPGFFRSVRSNSELEQPETPLLTLVMLDKCIRMALPVGSPEDHPIFCPMGPAVPTMDSLNIPPFLLCVAENDLFKDREMEYYQAMKKANKDVELLINPGMGHSFYLNKIAVDMDPHTGAQTEALIEGIIKFIKRH